MTNIRLVQCEGKVAFDSFDQANTINERRRKGKNSIRRDVYHCSVCGKWHAGSRPPEGKAKRMLRDRVLNEAKEV